METIKNCYGEFICLGIEGGCCMVEAVCFKMGNSPYAKFLMLCLLFPSTSRWTGFFFLPLLLLSGIKFIEVWPRRTNLIFCSDYASSPQSLSGDLQKTVKSTPLKKLKVG